MSLTAELLKNICKSWNFIDTIQVAELEAEFEKVGNEKPQQQRFLRSQQDLKAKMEEQAAAGGGTANEGEGRGIKWDMRGKGDRRKSFKEKRKVLGEGDTEPD